jgi:hypothetical protein
MAPRLRLPAGPTEQPWHRDPARGVEAATSLTNRIVAYLDAGPVRATQAL